MLRYLSKKKAQTTLEYAILIGVIVAGLIAMQVYLKRGYQGKLRASADDIGQQFSPERTTYIKNTNSNSDSDENLADGVTNTIVNDSRRHVDLNEDIGALNNEVLFE
jgi:uncharacterized protein (UPF0333 family)